MRSLPRPPLPAQLPCPSRPQTTSCPAAPSCSPHTPSTPTGARSLTRRSLLRSLLAAPPRPAPRWLHFGAHFSALHSESPRLRQHALALERDNTVLRQPPAEAAWKNPQDRRSTSAAKKVPAVPRPMRSKRSSFSDPGSLLSASSLPPPASSSAPPSQPQTVYLRSAAMCDKVRLAAALEACSRSTCARLRQRHARTHTEGARSSVHSACSS